MKFYSLYEYKVYKYRYVDIYSKYIICICDIFCKLKLMLFGFWCDFVGIVWYLVMDFVWLSCDLI